MRAAVFLFALCAAIAAPAHAVWAEIGEQSEALLSKGGYMTGQDLYSAGKGAMLIGYVMAIHDADRGAKTGFMNNYCVPDSVKSIQLADVAFKHLDMYPETRHESAAYLVRKSFVAVWPCRRQN
jgi:hypothetical protein